MTSRIDYCNSVLHGVSAVHLQPLQNLLSSAACVILWKQRLGHIIADICDLMHLLAVQRRIECKMCMCVCISHHPSTSQSYASLLQQWPYGVISATEVF